MLEAMREDWTDDRLDEDNRQLRREMMALRTELRADNSKLATELRARGTELAGELRGEMNTLRQELRGEIYELREEILERRFKIYLVTMIVGFGGLILSRFIG